MMRRCPPSLVIGATVLCIALTLLVALGAVRGMLTSGSSVNEAPVASIDIAVLVRTIGVALSIAILSTMLALPCAWLMRSLAPRWTVLLVAPMLLPIYLVHAAWSQARAPGTLLGNALQGGDVDLWRWANLAQAVVALALWSWPIAALIIGARAIRIDQSTLDALALERSTPISRCRLILAMLRPGMVAAIAVISLLMMGSAVPLHVAQVETYAIVIWRRLSESASPASAWIAAWPLLVLAIVGGWVIASRILSSGVATAQVTTHVRTKTSRIVQAAAGAVWIVSVVLPMTWMALAIPNTSEWSKFVSMTGDSLRVSGLIAFAVAGVSLLIAVASAVGFSSPHDAAAHRLCRLGLRLWLILALVPGVLVGSALVSASMLPMGSWISQTYAGVVIANLVRFGAVAMLAGWWLAHIEPQAFRDLRSLYTDAPVRVWLRTSAPLQAGAILGVTIAVGLLALHEIEATVIVAPPGTPTLSQHLLSLLHYLRDDQLAVGVTIVSGGGLLLACGAGLMGARTLEAIKRMAAPSLVILVCLVVPACDGIESGDGVAPRATFGELGTGPGQFFYPRAIDASDDRIWIIDKTARVQGFTRDGEPTHEWKMQSVDRGKPTGITIGPDGLIYVADTHEFRIAVFMPHDDGSSELVRTWGKYGEGPGEFIFATDIAIIPSADGVTPERFYVSEYGGNDRISVFDAKTNFLFEFGEPGFDPDPKAVRFSRPQSIVYLPQRRELLIADAANHRLGLFTLKGEVIEWIGAGGGMPGRGPEEFSYPYGLAVLGDGSVLVAEYGGNRVQHLDLSKPAGFRSVRMYGGPGRGPGEMVTPWGVAVMDQSFFVLDSGNSRVHRYRVPRGAVARRAGGGG